MGIVKKQAIANTISTYLGFGIGAINTLFLYTHFLSKEYYGLVTFILSTANLMMPLMAFGVHNALVKFYSSYKQEKEQNRFLTFMLFLPLVFIVFIGFIGTTFYETFATWLSKENAIVKNYAWLIYVTAIAMAYFEIFYAWAKVQMKSMYGNFLKEVFHRICISILLISVWQSVISVQTFIYCLTGVYYVRMFLMKITAFSIKLPKLDFVLPKNAIAVIKYAGLIIIAGSIAVVILDVDKFMIGRYLPIEHVAFYGVAVYISTVIIVPSRAMHQITHPLTAQFINQKNTDKLKELYKKSSLTLLVIGGIIFVLIVCNIHQLYTLIDSAYSTAVNVVFFISAAKLFDNAMGNNNAILFSSDYYRMVLLFGVILVFLVVVLNIVLIPKYGINGAAIATFLAISIYNTIKLLFVKFTFKMLPFTFNTLKAIAAITASVVVFYFWDFNFHPIVNIILKSTLISIFYLSVTYYFNISEDVTKMISSVLKRKTRSL